MGDPIVLFFLLGVFARLVRSDLRLPDGLYDILAFYLLLAIGLKGGVELSRQPLADLAPQVGACIALGLAIPFVLVPVLRSLRFNRADSASIAGHYGSVSVVTFAVAVAYIEKQELDLEAHAALWVALMEAPGLVTAIFLARWPRQAGESTPWGQLGHDVFLGKSVLLLVGGLIIGAVVGESGVNAMQAVFVAPFKGILALFLLELGLVVGDRLPGIRRYGLRLVGFALLAPLGLALLGAGTALAMGLSAGGVAVMATLAASASYIAAPTAMRIAVAEADSALAITASLAITFPFNLLVGIPLYTRLAGALAG
ncbi:MAG: sodium-dependent bicarbonate transport family permease [Ramlibacter sp.]